MKYHSANWSDLCPELLSEIADRLETRPNVYNFRSVCKNWRFPLSQIPRTLPHLSPLLPLRFTAVKPDFFSFLSSGTLHHLIADAVYLIRPRNRPECSKPWLVTVEELYRGKLSIRYPLSRVRAKGMFYKGVNCPETLNLFDFDVTLIARGCSIRAPEPKAYLSSNGGLRFKNKLVLFANPNSSKCSINDYSALLWYEDGSVAWVRLSRCLDWGFLACKGTSKFDDIVNFKGRVYAVDRTGRVYVVHYELESKRVSLHPTLKMERIVNEFVCSGCDSDRRKRLVVDSSGVLYLIERVNYLGKLHFRVFKLDEYKCKWDEVIGVGEDRILFVGYDWCFFASAADFPGCRGNCIFFFKNSFPEYGDRRLTVGAYFKETSNESNVSVFHFEDGKVAPISAFAGYSDILWPPPAWIYPNFSLSRS